MRSERGEAKWHLVFGRGGSLCLWWSTDISFLIFSSVRRFYSDNIYRLCAKLSFFLRGGGGAIPRHDDLIDCSVVFFIFEMYILYRRLFPVYNLCVRPFVVAMPTAHINLLGRVPPYIRPMLTLDAAHQAHFVVWGNTSEWTGKFKGKSRQVSFTWSRSQIVAASCSSTPMFYSVALLMR